MSATISIEISLQDIDILVTVEEARELHKLLNELFRPANVWTEKQREAHRAKKPATAVWTEGEKERRDSEKERRDREDKWSEVGKKFAAGAHPADNDFVSRIVPEGSSSLKGG